MARREGFSTLTPYVFIRGAEKAIEFYVDAFNARKTLFDKTEAGKVRHAEIRIGDSMMMVVDEFEGHDRYRGVQAYGGSAVQMFLYVDDADALFQQALRAGATVVLPMEDKPYGRSGGVADPFGITWWITTHRE